MGVCIMLWLWLIQVLFGWPSVLEKWSTLLLVAGLSSLAIMAVCLGIVIIGRLILFPARKQKVQIITGYAK